MKTKKLGNCIQLYYYINGGINMQIDAFLTPYFPEQENLFKDAIVVMLDILRAGTTITAALSNGAKEVIPSDTLDKAVRIFSNLSREVRFLGGERNGLKPDGFDAGNSPFDYSEQAVKGKNVIISTTNGTKTFVKAKNAKHRIIGAFVNMNAVLDFIFDDLDNDESNFANAKVCFLCSGTNGRISYEDTLCAGAMINSIYNRYLYKGVQISDSAEVARYLYNFHSSNMKDFLMTREHPKYLQKIGYEKDIDLCFTFDKYPVVPLINNSTITLSDKKN